MCVVVSMQKEACLALQFERTLIVAEEDSFISYLEGCTAPSYDKNQVSRRTQSHHLFGSQLSHALWAFLK